jgi:hypothetical protein
MKNIFINAIAFCITSITFSACSKCKTSDVKIGVGVITGQDVTLCACCGGNFITIDKQQYLIQQDISAQIPSKTPYPISVKLMYAPSTNGCGWKNIISVQAIEICK